MFYPFQKRYLYPCNRTFHLLRSQRLPHRCSPSPQGKRKVSVKAQLKCTWLLASSAQSEAASCIRGRSRALSLRGEGEAIHRITASARLPQKFVSEILLCAPQAPTKTGFQSNFSAFSVTRLRAAIFAWAQTPQYGGAELCLVSKMQVTEVFGHPHFDANN